MEYFIEQVLSWQNKLNVADAVIFTWMQVQRTWSHLESIFVCSEDLRVQLVEDAERFDEVDAEFKVCQRQACPVLVKLPQHSNSCKTQQLEKNLYCVRFIKCNLCISVHSQKTEVVCFLQILPSLLTVQGYHCGMRDAMKANRYDCSA